MAFIYIVMLRMINKLILKLLMLSVYLEAANFLIQFTSTVKNLVQKKLLVNMLKNSAMLWKKPVTGQVFMLQKVDGKPIYNL